jgi:hypothetical protein
VSSSSECHAPSKRATLRLTTAPGSPTSPPPLTKQPLTYSEPSWSARSVTTPSMPEFWSPPPASSHAVPVQCAKPPVGPN